MRDSPSKVPWLALALLAVLAAPQALAVGITDGCGHVSDGLFNGSASSVTDGPEWGCATVSKSGFAQVGNAGGAFLYADQNGHNLNLMYDYAAGASTASFFDVFFEVVPDGHAYLVRLQAAGGLEAFERPIGSVAPLDAHGSFDVGAGSGWTPLTAADLAIAQFQGAVAFGTSQNNPSPHPMAEFQLTINQPGANGIYDPSPAFWSASVKTDGGADPPISSGIFTLNPDGTTTVTPVLGPGGAPVMQGSVLPEPATLTLFMAGLFGLRAARRACRLPGG